VWLESQMNCFCGRVNKKQQFRHNFFRARISSIDKFLTVFFVVKIRHL
jgi:hypothetical protein